VRRTVSREIALDLHLRATSRLVSRSCQAREFAGGARRQQRHITARDELDDIRAMVAREQRDPRDAAEMHPTIRCFGRRWSRLSGRVGGQAYNVTWSLARESSVGPVAQERHGDTPMRLWGCASVCIDRRFSPPRSRTYLHSDSGLSAD